MELLNFLVLKSPNLGNIGTVKQRPEGFVNPDYYQISDEELESFKAMSTAHRNAFISEKLEAQIGTPIQVKKKVAPIVEPVAKVEEPVSVEMPETEIDEPLNEPVNEVKEEISESEYNEIKEGYKEKAKEIAKEHIEELKELANETTEEIVKAKRAYNKKVK